MEPNLKWTISVRITYKLVPRDNGRSYPQDKDKTSGFHDRAATYIDSVDSTNVDIVDLL